MAIQWIKTTRQLGQAVKNVARMRQILAVFSKYGFASVIDRTNLSTFLPKKMRQENRDVSQQSFAERLRHAFEELGPTFVKLGQLLSTRADLFPENFIEELTKLQDNVQPISFDAVRKVLEEELHVSIETHFSSFNPTPLASASIGQVHEATLKTGEKVVVKVQRPGIDKTIQNDVSLLAFIAKALERYVPESRIFDPSTLVDEFFRSLNYELDYKIEANNMKKISENLVSFDEIVIPNVYKQFSTHKVLTQEKIDGIRVNDLAALDAAGVDRKQVVKSGARAFLKTVMIDGLFHGDMHGGNIFILPGNRLGVIDFGIVGRLSQKARDQLATMVVALISEDYETVCYEYAELGGSSSSIDFDAFQREVRNTLSPYLGLPISEVNAGKVLIEATRIATQYQIKVPGEWMIVFRAILTMEGMGRSLDPEFDFMSLGQELVADVVKGQYSFDRIKKEVLWMTKDTVSLLQALPRQLRWMFRKFNSDDFAFEIKIPELKTIRNQLQKNSRKNVLAVLSAAMLVSSAVALQSATAMADSGMPPFHFIYMGAGILLGILAVL